MFNQVYHLRKTKMIVYQFAMILTVVSESIGTAALSDYVDQQDGISRRSGGKAMVQNNDIVGVLSYNIFIGIAVATIFGSGFFFDLFWPERHESKGVKLAWKICSVVISFMTLADAIAVTVIVATRSAYITGVSKVEADYWFNANGKPNRVYKHNGYCVASAVFLWLGVPAAFASTYIMWKSLAHNDQYGPKSSKYHTKGEEAEMGATSRSVSGHGHGHGAEYAIPIANGHNATAAPATTAPPTTSAPLATHTGRTETTPYPGT